MLLSDTHRDFVISTYMWAVSPSGGFGFFMHGFICVFVFLCTFRPFLQYFGAIFLLWEVSTLFLNPHWFMVRLHCLRAVRPADC